MMNPTTASKATASKGTSSKGIPSKGTPSPVTPPALDVMKAAPVVAHKTTHNDPVGAAADVWPGIIAARKSKHEEIARRAHEIYVKKGCPSGQNEQNWLQAEKELGHLKPASGNVALTGPSLEKRFQVG